MIVKIKKVNNDAVIPKLGSSGASGFDLVAISYTKKNKYVEYDTGLAFEIPKGYMGLVCPRSSVSETEVGTYMRNSVGIIDSDYRGTIKMRFSYAHNRSADPRDLFWSEMNSTSSYIKIPYEIGQKIGQIIFVPSPFVELEEVSDLEDTERGDGGFGSTGI